MEWRKRFGVYFIFKVMSRAVLKSRTGSSAKRDYPVRDMAGDVLAQTSKPLRQSWVKSLENTSALILSSILHTQRMRWTEHRAPFSRS
jgi:hypothetical protein